MAVPKKRQSNTRRNMRRANHDKAKMPTIMSCDNCEEPKLYHRVCPGCGYYRGRSIVEKDN